MVSSPGRVVEFEKVDIDLICASRHLVYLAFNLHAGFLSIASMTIVLFAQLLRSWRLHLRRSLYAAMETTLHEVHG